MQKRFVPCLNTVNIMNGNLIAYQKENPIKFLILILLYAVGSSALPNLNIAGWLKLGKVYDMLFFTVLKFCTFIFPVYLTVQLGQTELFKVNLKKFLISFLVFFPFFLVCLNNIPFVSVLTRNSRFNIDSDFVIYLFLCLSISFFEELVFRGLVVKNLEYTKIKNNDFLKIIVSSLIFSVCHLVNAFSLNLGAILMQVGYTFLIGAMCCFSYYFSKSLLLPVLLHFIFDLGGLMAEYEIVLGNIWDKTSILVTAILSVVTIIYALCVFKFIYLKDKNESSNSKS